MRSGLPELRIPELRIDVAQPRCERLLRQNVVHVLSVSRGRSPRPGVSTYIETKSIATDDRIDGWLPFKALPEQAPVPPNRSVQSVRHLMEFRMIRVEQDVAFHACDDAGDEQDQRAPLLLPGLTEDA